MLTKIERAIKELMSLRNNANNGEKYIVREIDDIIDILNEHPDYDIAEN